MQKLLYLLLLQSGVVCAADYDRYAYGSDYYQSCQHAALNTHAGKIIKVEFKIESNQPVYEFDIRAPDGRDWDIECHAESEQIIEVEEEVSSVHHPLFLDKKRIDEKHARAVALDAWPGDVLEIEYEIEPDGAASYEFDIHTYKGIEMKIEVDATTGDIVEQSQELWQEGYE